MNETQLRNKVVGILKGWIGLKESNGSHKKIIDIYNSQKKLPVGYKMKYTDDWCAATVSAAFVEAGLTDIAPTECSCIRMIDRYKKIGCWEERDDYTPRAGDVIMYDWEDNGKGDNKGNPNHVGVVVGIVGGKIRVIEGNKNNAVGYRDISLNGKYIRGFCLPNFASKSSESCKTESNSVATQAVKKIIPARSKDKSVTGAVRFEVTAGSGLNVRSSASSKDNSNLIRTLPKGSKVVWYGYYTGDFYLVQLPKSGTGYVHKDWLKPV